MDSQEEKKQEPANAQIDISQLPMYATNPVILKDGLKSFVVYTLLGTYIKEPLIRRYSDFSALRAKLVERWPGVYIPNIPPKKAIGNLDSKFIEERVKLINKFCLKLTLFKEIFNSHEISAFMLNTPDVNKTLNSLQPQSYEDIVKKYKIAFPGYYETFDLQTTKTKLARFLKFSQKALVNFENFKNTVYTSMTRHQSEIDNYITMLNLFSAYEKLNMMEFSRHDEERLVFFNMKNTELCRTILNLNNGLENPYTSLYDALVEEQLDMEAMIEALISLTGLNDTYDRLSQDLISVEGSIATLKAGKSNLKSIFSFKSKDQNIEELENQKFSIEKTLTDLGLVIKLASYNMELFIESFKEEKLAEYHCQLKQVAEKSYLIANRYKNLWECVSNNPNVQSAKKSY